MAEADLGKVKLTDAELSEKIIEVNGGVKLGKDADGNPGYVVKDDETGADTVIPFSSGGGSAGELPIESFICFAGTEIVCTGGSSSYCKISHLFDAPIEISKMNQIKTISNMNWMSISSYDTSGLVRRAAIFLYVEDDSGGIKRIQNTSEYLTQSTNTATINLTGKEIIIPLSLIVNYKNLLGIGCEFYQHPGSGSAKWFKSRLGNDGAPNASMMKCVIS
ncbi:MAG: hypothetical protein HDQ96_04815 [Lachnospiraceae bacterium]|nr:hypothetical protein [Lachnospiraceae bacterium]